MFSKLLNLLILAGNGLAGLLQGRRKAKAANLETAAHEGDAKTVNAFLAKARRDSKLLPIALLGSLVLGGCATRVERVPESLYAAPIEWGGQKGWFLPAPLMADILTTLDAHTRCHER